MKKRISLPAVLILIFVLFLCGCGRGASLSSMDTVMTVAETAAAGAQNQNYDLGYNTAAEMPMEAMPMAPVPQEMEEENIKMEDMAEEGSRTLSVPLTRKLIRNMELQVETTDFDPLITALQAKVAEFQGYIEQSDISGNSITNQGRPSKKYAHMSLRIPAEKLDLFISQVEAAGNITYKSESVSDVTLQYSDIESRLKTLRMEQERLWELLAKADTTEAIILLEERLTEVSSEIESCESRMRYLDNSVTYSTVYITIEEVDIESPTQPETAWQQIQRGFTRNLISLMDNLTQFMISLLSNLPVILFLALLVLVIVRIIRRISKHKAAKPEKYSQQPKSFPISSMHFSNQSDRTQAVDTTAANAGNPDTANPSTANTASAGTANPSTDTANPNTAGTVNAGTDTANKEDEA